MAGCPRASILSIFDPLSSAAEHGTNEDKENLASDASFFHPPGAKSPKPFHTLRRRLVDIGDMTMDEPSIQDLLEDEEELEQLHAIEDDQDGNTLTWKDMAKAATPKWSNRHAASFATPKVSPSQRVPLGELSLTEEATPVARKKPYKRPIVSATSSFSEPDRVPTCTIAIFPPSPQKDIPSLTDSIPPKAKPISDSDPSNLLVELNDPLGSSVSTLDLPTVTGVSIADTSLPLSMSMGSSQSSQSSLSSLSPTLPAIDTPPSRATLRPVKSESFDSHRHSVDLGASFQLHLNSSDAICDLLNEKISFLDAKDDSFLRTLEMDSFDEDNFEVPLPEEAKKTQKSRLVKTQKVGMQDGSDAPVIEKPAAELDRGRRPTFTKRSLQTIIASPRDQMRKSSFDIDTSSVPSTPNSARSSLDYIAPPVPGLKIVKKAKVLTRRLSTATNLSAITAASTSSTTSLKHSSHAPAEISTKSHTKFLSSTPSSPVTNEPTTRYPVNVTNPRSTRRPTPVAQSIESTSGNAASGNGPRRVLVSGPKLSSTTNSRATSSLDQARPSTNGPRRVPVNMTGRKSVESEPPTNPVATLKQPAKYSTSGPSSAIPKPISRIPGSRLPAPSSMTGSKSRNGAPSGAGTVTNKGILNRRIL